MDISNELRKRSRAAESVDGALLLPAYSEAMSRYEPLLAAGALVSTVFVVGACNLLTGAGDLEIADGATVDTGSGGSGTGAGATSGNSASNGSNGNTGSGATGNTGNTSTSGTGGTPETCGDEACEAPETCANCAMDCGECPATCGNASCEVGETCSNCPGDCGVCPPSCGDGMCNGNEDCTSCAGDCGACPPSCGDTSCNGGETCQTCPGDCGACPVVCGDGNCNGNETCSSCAGDCGQCPPQCGDGTCNGTETCMSCQGDCGQCPMGCEGASEATTALDSEEQAFLGIINAYRTQNGLGTFTACHSLNRAAQGHSEDMRDNDYFSHTGLDGSSPWDRACAACYDLGCGPQTAMAENIAAGNSGAQATFDQWKNSPGHNANMLNGNLHVIGIGRATGGGQYGSYWTNVFGGATEPSCN